MNNINQAQPEPQYNSLEDIRARKEELNKQLEKEKANISELWNNLFHSPEVDNTKAGRMTGIINTGISVFDGVMLGWKLYRKFNGSRLFKRR